jgi:hypothetical protein
MVLNFTFEILTIDLSLYLFYFYNGVKKQKKQARKNIIAETRQELINSFNKNR